MPLIGSSEEGIKGYEEISIEITQIEAKREKLVCLC